MRNAALALALLLLAAGAPPANVTNWTMNADGMVDVYLSGNKLQFVYPRVIVFDKDGYRVYTAQGYGGSHSVPDIMRAIQTPPKKNAPRIEGFAAWLWADGKPLDPATLKGRPTVAELGAPWCGPCHQLEAELRKVPGINLLVINADAQGRMDELKAALKKRLGQQ